MSDEARARAGQAEAEAQQAKARADAAVAALRGALFAVLDARGLACSDELRAEIHRCDDPAILQRWLARAATAATAREAIATERG